MSKEEIKNLLIEFVCEYDFTNWNNDKVYEKFSDLIYKQISDLEAKLAEKDLIIKCRTIGVLVEKAEKIDQDKISFAVEQINKIKNDLYENEKINIRACDFDEIDNIFDNQINILRNNKDGIH